MTQSLSLILVKKLAEPEIEPPLLKSCMLPNEVHVRGKKPGFCIHQPFLRTNSIVGQTIRLIHSDGVLLIKYPQQGKGRSLK